MSPRLPCTCTATQQPCPACTAWQAAHPWRHHTGRVPDPDAPPARPGRVLQDRVDLLARLTEAEQTLQRQQARGVAARDTWRVRRRIAAYQARLAAQITTKEPTDD